MQQSQINLLLIEDNHADAELIQLLLASSDSRSSLSIFHIHHATTLQAGLQHLREKTADIVLLDLSLPDSQGLETFHALASEAVPTIILSGLQDDETAVRTVQQGAQDYLVKGSFDGKLLAHAIRHAIERHRLLTEHQHAKQQLSQKASELEARNADLDAFSHTLAHQIRSLLGQIIGYASFADTYHADEHNPELQLVLKRILNSSHKMNSVMQELLTLASVRSGEVELEPFDMQPVLDAAIKRLGFLQDQYHGEITQSVPLSLAFGNSGWIEEVWVNYISNALKYGGAPPKLTIGFEPLDDKFGRFWVQDNGEGLTKAEQMRLFRPHTRLKKRLVRGEGLGLSIVARIIHKCGGKVGVESELGEGSRFWFTLPLAP